MERFDEFNASMLESIGRLGTENQDVVRKLARFAAQKGDWFDDFTARAIAWQCSPTGPRESAQGALAHMREEIEELHTSIQGANIKGILEELADIVMIAISIASKCTDASLRETLEEKFARVQARRYPTPGADGVSRR